MAEIASLLKTLQCIQLSIKTIKEFAETNIANANVSAEDAYQRIERLENMLSKYMEVENKLFRHDPSQNSTYHEMEEIYYSAMSCLNKMVPNRRQSSQLNTSISDSMATHNIGMIQRFPSNEVKLPKIKMPQFSGDYIEWQSFYELFVKQVHEREGLSNAQRLQYLKCYLKGEAHSLIMHMAITDANYAEALAKLKDRYDKKRYTINAFIQKFMDQPVIQQSNVSLIKKLFDTSDGVVRGLKALGSEAESRDPWLIYMIISKLDVESKTLWAQETKNLECPTLKKLFEFLADRVDTLETFGMNKKPSPSSKTQAIKSFTTTVSNCALCKGDASHKLFDCKTFKEMNVNDRLQFIKGSQRCFNCLNVKHSVYECKSKWRCQICRRKHHTLLHLKSNSSVGENTSDVTSDRKPETSSIKKEVRSTNALQLEMSSRANSTETNHLKSPLRNSGAILPTAIVKLRDRHGNLQTFRALLDSGSESNFITEKCIMKFQLPRNTNSINIRGLGQSNIGRTKGSVEIEVSNVDETYKTKTWSYVVPRISSVSSKNISIQSEANKINKLCLADPRLFESGDIDVLFGVNIFFEVLECTNKMEFENMSAYHTKFGWIIVRNQTDDQDDTETFNGLLDLDVTLKQFWELESIPNASKISPEEEDCEVLFSNTTVRHDDGKFMVRLPFKDGVEKLGSSYHTALKRLLSMERRFSKDNSFKQLYHKFMEEYEALGHMSLIGESDKRRYYMPHHGVLKNSTTTKLRVVFDASAKSATNLSLNDVLKVGPSIQSSLVEILLRFRQHKYVLTGDIEKMYRMVWIDQEDAQFQRILWRKEPTMTPKEYQLNTVTYGTASASYLATRSLKEAALRFENPESEAAKSLIRDVYVDDLMTGSSNLNQLIQIRNEIIGNLTNYGFNLRKLRSNITEIISNGADAELVAERVDKEISECPVTNKVLGMIWDSSSDLFSFHFQPSESSVHTKRTLLSESSKIFDPLGLLTPITIKIKILFQKLWLLPMKWDDELPSDIKSEWLKIRSSFTKMAAVQIPRWLHIENECILHGFSDSSEAAYAACIYAVTHEGNTPVSRLVVAKSRVCPIKQISLPRLELQAALLLAQLMTWVQKTLTIRVKHVILWTDSQIVLDWLASHPRRWKTFIANRTAEILDTHKFKRALWQHVKSEHNPADCASRGIFLEELENHRLWWTGPAWLIKNDTYSSYCPTNVSNVPQEEENTVLVCTTVADFLEVLIERHSSFYKACHALAKAIKYIEVLRARIHPELKDQYNPDILPSNIRQAEIILCKHVQKTILAEDYNALLKNCIVPKHSSLRSLHPFIHEDGLIRVGGRIDNSISSFAVKHPVILPRKSQLSKAIVFDYHRSFNHAGIMLCLAMVRRKFWIVHCKNIVRATINKCLSCIRTRPKLENQLMGDLPAVRVQYEHAFANVGIDYCGPFRIHLIRKRGSLSIKAYVCLFVCMATKAVHAEVVTDLTTESFFGALHRFTSRRGLCRSIYSDNGTNFVGAKNYFKEIYKFLQNNTNEINAFLLRKQITWHFIPAGAPHMGGLWEASVKLLKNNLMKVAGSNIITLEEFTTLIARVEAAINSRPLCKDQREESDVITPSHLVIGRALIDIPEAIFTNKSSRWHVVQQIYHHFWKRWHTDYITALQNRCKWRELKKNVKVGDVVLLDDDRSPSLNWPMARIIDVHPGTDGLIRVVTIKLADGGVLKRPIHKICLLPFGDSAELT